MSDTKVLNINGPLSAMAARIAMQVESMQKRINDLSGSTNRNISAIGDDSYDALRIALNVAETEIRRISNKSERDAKTPGKRTNQQGGKKSNKPTATTKTKNPAKTAAKPAAKTAAKPEAATNVAEAKTA